MSQVRIDIRELDAGTAAGAFHESHHERAPLAVHTSALPRLTEATPRQVWLRRGLRVIRNAAIAVAVMTLVPIGFVMVRGDRLTRAMFYGHDDLVAKVRLVDAARPLRLATVSSITPMQAGLALNAMQPIRVKVAGFETNASAARPAAPWQKPLSPALFATARPDIYDGPSSRSVLVASAQGYSPAEMQYLRALATAPVWRDFDIVARAPAVDMVGGQFKLPFGPDAMFESRPLPSFKESRELAYAAVSRAAYHMALGQKDSAETVLRSIVSYGFVLIDNGTSAMDELMGAVIVGVGRDALQRFYTIQHDPRVGLPELALPRKADLVAASGATQPTSVDDARRRIIARVDDPSVPLAERFESLRMLSVAQCTNVPELLLGPHADVRDAIERAPRTMARFPSERALMDLQGRTLTSYSSDHASLNVLQSLAVSSATVAGVVLRNPRLASCTRMLSWMSGS